MASSLVPPPTTSFFHTKDLSLSASSQRCQKHASRRVSCSIAAPQQTQRQPSTTGSVKTAMTMTEKILARAAEKEKATPGDNIWVNVDVLMTHDVCGPGSIGIFKKEFGEDAKVWDREKLVIIPDHYIFTSDERANRNVDILRDFCQEQNIKYFYDIKDLSNFKVNPDYKGVCHVALAQEGHCRPGEVLLGTDSHTCTAGAFGQFATGIGNTDAGFVLGAGKLLLKVPPTLRFVLDGEMPSYLLAKDLILQIIGEISVAGATYKSMEFVGSTVESLTMEERMTLCNMVVEAGGKNGVIPPDSVTYKYLEGLQWHRHFSFNMQPHAACQTLFNFAPFVFEAMAGGRRQLPFHLPDLFVFSKDGLTTHLFVLSFCNGYFSFCGYNLGLAPLIFLGCEELQETLDLSTITIVCLVIPYEKTGGTCSLQSN